MENFADRLIAAIRNKNSPVVVGLDPHFKLIPDAIKQAIHFLAKKIALNTRQALFWNLISR